MIQKPASKHGNNGGTNETTHFSPISLHSTLMLLTKISCMRVKCGVEIPDIGIGEPQNRARASPKIKLPLALISSQNRTELH